MEKLSLMAAKALDMRKISLFDQGDFLATYAFKDNDKMVVQRQQDIDPILRNNQKLRDFETGWSKSKELKHAASIPLIVVEEWFKKGINIFDPNDAPKIKQMLNSVEYAHLRTSKGVI